MSSAGIALRPISEAPKDNTTVIWAKLRDDLVDRFGRDDLVGWQGAWAPLRHPGIYEHDGRTWDHGWGIRLPVGHGGFPDDWIEGWISLADLAARERERERVIQALRADFGRMTVTQVLNGTYTLRHVLGVIEALPPLLTSALDEMLERARADGMRELLHGFALHEFPASFVATANDIIKWMASRGIETGVEWDGRAGRFIRARGASEGRSDG